MKPDPVNRISIEANPSAEDLEFLQDQIDRYNIRVTGFDDFQRLAVFVRDEQGQITAGISGYSWGGMCEIEYVWIQESQRRQGIGTQLLQAAEEEAARRGCHVIILDSYTFQAPGFYQKMGYTTVGIYDGCPIPYRRHYFEKRLDTKSMETHMHTTDVFPILSWGLQPWHPMASRENGRSTLELLQEMKACGINLAGFARPEELDLVHEAGLKAFVFDPRASDYDFRKVDEDQARRNISSLVNEVGRHPAVYGYYIKDEPNAAEFPGLAAVARAVRECAPGQMAYINLFPNYATQEQLGAETYEEYVQEYVETVRPLVVSYDHYALMEGGGLRKSYFANLETIRRTAARAGLPFWNIVLSNCHFTYREPDPAGFRFQAFTTLAYGGKGISWFTYLTPEVGNYRLAPLDPYGNRTPTWSYLQSANLQLLQLAPTYNRLASTRVYHFGETPQGCRPAPAGALVQSVRGLHEEFVLGDLRHPDGSDYIMLVNKDFTRSTPFEIVFNGPRRKVERVSPYSGEHQELAGENNWLAPGQGVLLRVTPL